ncbi:uncharacterized protein LOC131937265 [Physella acuta]|uniref:uncharacterized protein LOC131937265 n=1 Tax=Physella acuta TaxID=109671 RepID=UPI0027DCA102|nr:uncharacterized protein LOC131937265 [Physella acuta]
MTPYRTARVPARVSFIVVICAVLTNTAFGYSGGAPGTACNSMLPNHHGSTPASGPAPFQLILSKSTYSPGEVIEGSLSGTQGSTFKGFLISARTSTGSDSIGTFSHDATNHIICNSTTGNALTHSNTDVKSSVKFNWTAPSTLYGDLVFKATVVRDGMKDYFTNVVSAPIKPAVPQVGKFFRDSDCGISKGCYSNCANNECDWEMSWNDTGDNYTITLKAFFTSDNKYVSLGFSNTSNMAPASVFSCVTFNGTTSVEVGYTTGRHGYTPFADPSQEIDGLVSSYKDGVLQCTFSRQKLSTDLHLFNLTEPWYLITAIGDAAPNIKRHSITNRYKTATKIDLASRTVDEFFPGTTSPPQTTTASTVATTTPKVGGKFANDPECGVSKGCYSNCANNECDWEMSWKDTGDNYTITLKAFFTSDNKYVSLGFSNLSMMAPASVFSCLTFNGTTSVEVGYTTVRHGYQSMPKPSQEIGDLASSYKDGVLQCTFSRQKLSTDLHLFNLTEPWYLITAIGDARPELVRHTNRYKTDVRVELTNKTSIQLNPITTTLAPQTTSSGPVIAGFTKDPECGQSKGCWSDCRGSQCSWELSWKDAGSSYRITIRAVVSNGDQWLALGFNNQPGMTVEGISDQNKTLVGGLLSCTFLRVKESSNPQIYNLTQPWYLITAKGPLNADGTLHIHSKRYKTADKINLANALTDLSFDGSVNTQPTTTIPPTPENTFNKDNQCGKTKGCYSNCAVNKCSWEMSWQEEGDDYRIVLKSYFSGDNKYVALGFNEQPAMGDASVVSCVTHNGAVTAVKSHTVGYSNIPLQNPTEGVSNPQNSFQDGILQCSFLLRKESSNEKFQNLTGEFYLITARGDTNADGSLKKHDNSNRYKTSDKVNLTSTSTDVTFGGVVAPTTPSPPAGKFRKDPDCGSKKGCYSNCKNDECDLLLGWAPLSRGSETASRSKVASTNMFEITLKSKVASTGNHYIAIGFSNAAKMDVASVLACTVYNGNVDAYQSTNPGQYNLPLPNPKEGITVTKASFVDGLLECIVHREASSANNSKIFDLNQPWHLISARGAASPGGHLNPHDGINRYLTQSQIDFKDTSVDISLEDTEYPLIQAHGCLMVIAWMLSASIGIGFARFLKPLWPDSMPCGVKVWFAIHRAAMVLTFLLGCAGFVLIFVEVKDYSQIIGEDYKKAHPILGIITTSLLVINPFMSLLRCAPNHPRRPVFNYAHWFVGMSAHILAAVTITVGLYLPKAQVDSTLGLYIMIAYAAWHVVFFLIMSLIDYLANAAKSKVYKSDLPGITGITKKSHKKGNEYKLNSLDNADDLADSVAQSSSKDPPYSFAKKILMLFHVAVLCGLTIAILYLIIKRDIEKD